MNKFVTIICIYEDGKEYEGIVNVDLIATVLRAGDNPKINIVNLKGGSSLFTKESIESLKLKITI